MSEQMLDLLLAFENAAVRYGMASAMRVDDKFLPASQRSHPDTLDAERKAFGAARVALSSHIASLEADRDRLDWLDRYAKYEIAIDADGDGVEVKRWHRKYLSYHNTFGRTVREAIDRFIEAIDPAREERATSPSAPASES